MKDSKRLIYILVCLMACLICLTASAQDGRPRLGLTVSPLQASPLLLQHLRLSEDEGLMINNIAVGSELEQSGLSQGDILLAINGQPVSKPADLLKATASLPTNASVTLDVIQKGEHKQLNLKLDNLPDEIVWKYAQPESRSRASMRSANPGSFSFSQNIQPRQNGGSSASHMMFKSMVATPDGMKSSTVTLEGSKDDPDSLVTVQIGSDTYKSRIADIGQLPEDARTAAQQAIAQSGNFSFSFGFGGNDLMEEMLRRHQEQMRMMDDFFNHQFMGPADDNDTKTDSVLKPVEPSADDIRS